MIASDTDIRNLLDEGLTIDPYNEQYLEPSSYDIHLSDEFIVYSTYSDVLRTDDDIMKAGSNIQLDSIILDKDTFILGKTEESFEIPDHIQAQVTGRSSVGRLSVEIHSTAGLIDPGFKGNIVLELSSTLPVELRAGDRVGQVYFQYLNTPADEPYGHEGSHYQNQSLKRSAFRQTEGRNS